MAKIRVYELAKDLSMTNKELLEKILDLNIEVGSHMSSLDDDSVAKIKSGLFGSSDKKMDEKRVRPTVIRRRKKAKKTPEGSSFFSEVQEENSNLAEVSAATDLGSGVDNLVTSSEVEVESTCRVTATVDIKLCSDKGSITEETARVIARPEPTDSFVEGVSTLASDPEDSDEPVTSMINSGESYSSKGERFAKASDPQGGKKEDLVMASLPSVEAPPGARQKKMHKDLSQDGPNSDRIKVIETSRPKKGKFRKDVSAKNVRRKDTPAKIIKKANLSKIELTGAVLATDGLEESKANANRLPTSPDMSERKNKRKRRTFKKKEVVEGAALYAGKRRVRRSRRGAKAKFATAGQKTQITTAKAIKRRVKVDETIVLADLAKRLGIKANEMIAKLMSMGVMVTVNQTIDFDTACLVANEFGYEVEKASFEEETILKKTGKYDPTKMVQRPPVVTIMGHVDHGKTSLLDAIRDTRVTAGEAGGITQHIGAYRVETEKGVIVFLDTPGHEAFSAMRSRGARVTDLVVLVVAADDGVMPQTVEAINHSKASDVPILVAINKMDKLDANPERVLRELSEHGLVTEEWGGDLISVKVSAKQCHGIDILLEMILLQAEMLELRADPDKMARGHVVESRLDSGRGPVATVLVQEGTLRCGDSVICGIHYGKVRALQDDIGRKVSHAGPSMPAEIIGLSGVPMAGDELVALRDEKDARQVSLHRIQKQRSKELAKTNRLSLEGLFERMQKGEAKDLNLIIKADVDGSIEALKDSLVKLSNDEVSINVVHSATGTISESDISLAAVSNAIIVGFNVRPNAKVHNFALDEHVDMRFYDVIYNVIKDVKGAIVGMMDSTYEERLLGRADVRQVFHVPKIGTIAGCYVTDGKIVRAKLVRLLRGGIIVYQGKNSSLRRFKDDVREVQGGYECGIGIENFNDIKVGDVIESYYMEEVKPEID